MKEYFVTNAEEYDDFISRLDTTVLSFDTETENESFLRTGVMSQNQESLRWHQQIVLGTSLADGKVAGYIDFLVFPEGKELVAQLLANTQLFFGHNIVFDAKAYRRINIDIFDKSWYDSMVAAHLLDENGEKGLKALAEKYLGEKEPMSFIEARRKGYSHPRFYKYAVNDAVWTWRLAQIMMNRIKEEGLAPLMNTIEMPFLKCVAEIEMNGMLVDSAKAQRLRKELAEKATQLEIKLLEIIKAPYSIQAQLFSDQLVVKSDVNLNSPEQLRSILFLDLGLQATEKTGTGALSTGVKVLEKLKGKHPFVDALLEYRVVQKLRSAFFEPLPNYIDSDGRVRSHYKDTGTKTGRLSCSQPNMQQLPRPRKGFPNTRACFIASPGYKFVGCDYSGQETRVLAHVSQDPHLISVVSSGKDLHFYWANKFYKLGLPEDALYENSPGWIKAKAELGDYRSKSKAITFGLSYGKGEEGFAKDFNLPIEESRKILQAYATDFPGVIRAIEQCKEEIRRTGKSKTIFGRCRHFSHVEREGRKFYPNAAFREGFNHKIQSPSADMIRLAAIATRKIAKEHPEWDMRIVATIHDENVYEVKEEYAEVAAQEIKKAFESAVSLSVPMVSSVSIGDDFGALK